MSPEYVMRGLLSEKSDVYSFGVLLLEVVSGRRNCEIQNNEEHFSLLNYAWQLWIESREIDVIDESLMFVYRSTTVHKDRIALYSGPCIGQANNAKCSVDAMQ